VAFGGAISSLKAVMVPMQSTAAHGGAGADHGDAGDRHGMPVIVMPVSDAPDAVGAVRSIKVASGDMM
jgi:hypothetical protein